MFANVLVVPAAVELAQLVTRDLSVAASPLMLTLLSMLPCWNSGMLV